MRIQLSDIVLADRSPDRRQIREAQIDDYFSFWHGHLYGHRCRYFKRQHQYRLSWRRWSIHLSVQLVLPHWLSWSYLPLCERNRTTESSGTDH